VPHATQRLGAPRGYYQLDFEGHHYVDTYKTFHAEATAQMHASFNTPRFRAWATRLLNYRKSTGGFDQTPPVVRADLGDMNMVTLSDLSIGTWLAVNVWNGSKASTVTATMNGTVLTGTRTQVGNGEAKKRGVAFADPLAMAMQATQGRVAVRSVDGGDDTAGFTTWSGAAWVGKPGPFPGWMLTDNSQHLWRVNLPAELPVGVHTVKIETTDRHGRVFTENLTFEVVEELPKWGWRKELWE